MPAIRAAQGRSCGTLNCGTCGSCQTWSANVCVTANVGTHDVCSREPYCCTTAWAPLRVSEANPWCGIAQPGCVVPNPPLRVDPVL